MQLPTGRPVRPDRASTALYCSPDYGPAFGTGPDFAVMSAGDAGYVGHAWSTYAEPGWCDPAATFHTVTQCQINVAC